MAKEPVAMGMELISDALNLEGDEVVVMAAFRKNEWKAKLLDLPFSLFEQFDGFDVRPKETLTTEEPSTQHKTVRTRRPHFDFYKIGLNRGDVLTFTENPEIQAEIVGNKTVVYNGVVSYISPLTKELLNGRGGSHPLKYWKIDGKTLAELYQNKYGGQNS